MSGFFSPAMLVSAHFATMNAKRLQPLQSIFSKACRVIAMSIKNRLQRRFPRAYGYANAPSNPMRRSTGFASRRIASRIVTDQASCSNTIRSESRIVLTDRSQLCYLHQAPPHVPVAKNMQKPGAFRQTFQPCRFD